MIVLTVFFFGCVEKQSDEKVVFELEAQKLIESYHNDKEASDVKYLNKVLTVRGITQSVVVKNGYISSIIIGTENEKSGVVSTFFSRDRPKEGAVVPGEEIRVRGLCSGILYDVLLTNSELLNKNLAQ